MGLLSQMVPQNSWPTLWVCGQLIPNSIDIAIRLCPDLMRDFLPGREEFFKNDGLSAVLLCVGSGDGKLVIKAMFLLEYCYTSGSEGM